MAGDNCLGVEDFDKMVVNHLANEFKQNLNKHIQENPRALHCLRTEDALI